MKNSKKKDIKLLVGLIVLLIVMDLIFFAVIREPGYNPKINPDDFSPVIDNKYFTLAPRMNFVYEGETEEGVERNEVYVTEETKTVMGVETRVVWDRVWLNGELIEDTKDWFAQDKEGNVWYFGEESKEIVDGKIVNTKGSWEAGVDGAKPGIIMKAEPKVGDSYRQEYYKGEAEDMAEVISLNESFDTRYKTFDDCLKTREWTPLELGADEYKFYCPEAFNVVGEIVVDGGEKIELLDIEYDVDQDESEISDVTEPVITEYEAREIALGKVSGEITDVSIEEKFGKIVYVVEIDDDGVETDVIIDSDTGEVLGIET